MFNNSSNLYGSEWLAIVFNNRNKNYGAYELRSQSSTILMKALFSASALFIALFVAPVIYSHYNPDEEVLVTRVIEINNPQVIHEMKKEEPKKAEPLKAEPIKEKIKTVKFSANIKVVEDTKVNLPPPTTDELKDVVIGGLTQDGVSGQENAMPSTITNGGGGGQAQEGLVDNSVHNIAGVEVYPEFPGGMAAWAKFIQRNLRYPYMAQDANVQGKVYLSFVVEKDGSITDVSVLKGIGAGCDEEAMRVIKKSPKWKAGQQNNQTVRVRYTMPISYTLTQ
ncbi:MAG: TonB family protein [Sphingobacteriaceae bacterium]|nr:TonB family protein [Sphingobacteriaceae bacterium]